MRRLICPQLCLLAILALPAFAQESASFRLKEGVINAGGHPADGATPSSSAFSISLDAIGHAIGGRALSSASFRMDDGFVAAYPPPGEVQGLVFVDHDTLAWNPERSIGSYALYRNELSSLSGLGYGNCLTTDITSTTTDDAQVPAVNSGYFYIVGARNRIDEQGTKGFDSGGSERPNPTPCP